MNRADTTPNPPNMSNKPSKICRINPRKWVKYTLENPQMSWLTFCMNVLTKTKLFLYEEYRSFHGNVIRRVTWSPGILGWQKICGWRASRVFCRDSFPVCLHFTHKQDHDYVLYWCGVYWTFFRRLVLFFYHPKKGKRRKLWLNAFSCKQWGSPS